MLQACPPSNPALFADLADSSLLAVGNSPAAEVDRVLVADSPFGVEVGNIHPEEAMRRDFVGRSRRLGDSRCSGRNRCVRMEHCTQPEGPEARGGRPGRPEDRRICPTL